MSRAYVTFSSRPSLIATLCPGVRADEHAQTFEVMGDAQLVRGARATIEHAMGEALGRVGREFPRDQATDMLNSLGWVEGYTSLIEARPDTVKFVMSDDTWHVLPELAPLPDGGWLDTLCPCYRTIGVVEQAPVRRAEKPSLAILFQGDHPFPSLALSIQRALSTSAFPVDVFDGTEFGPDPTRWHSRLVEVFRHRAVLFLGHLHRDDEHGEYGWSLDHSTYLPMAYVQQILGPARRRSALHLGSVVPEIVFTLCCCGAWEAPAFAGRPPLIFPRMFLDAGVRFFVGPWMDIAYPETAAGEALGALEALVSGFFRRWIAAPDDAVAHLHRAKGDCEFSLLTSLFQMYALGSERTGVARDQRAEPEGAWLSAVEPGDRLGDYEIDRQVWETGYSRTFLAGRRETGSRHLVQVLVDEWQGVADLQGRLDGAVAKLRAAKLGPGHLVPIRSERLRLARHGEHRDLLALIYDLQPGDEPIAWVPLSMRDVDPHAQGHFERVLECGANVSALLADLHGHRLQHGNLDSTNVLLRRVGAGDQPLLKDAWLHLARLPRSTRPHYAAPEEPLPAEGAEGATIDCWGLGVLLFELATGHAPFGTEGYRAGGTRPSIRAAMGDAAQRVPEALERVVRECLAPSPKLRPSSAAIARRLALAVALGGDYVSHFEDALRDLIHAGQRLFAVVVDDVAVLDSTLDGLATARHQVYVVAEGAGLTDRAGVEIQPWITANQYNDARVQAFTQSGLQPPPFPTADEVGTLNFAGIAGDGFESLRSAQAGAPPVVLVRGSDWWSRGDSEFVLEALRALKKCQSEFGSPVVIIAGSSIALEAEVSRSFAKLRFPWPSPTELFEHILGFSTPKVAEETAIGLAHQLWPCPARDLTYTLRMAALRYGGVDDRAMDVWHEARQSDYRSVPGVTYFPLTSLPDPRWLGLPPDIDRAVADWAAATRAAVEGEAPAALPRRVVIEAPGGCGKTRLALSLGSRTGRPVIRIDASQCLRGRLGESETMLRQALESAATPQGTVVLLDDADRFFADVPQGSDAGVVARMSGIFLAWLDAITPMTTFVVTSRDSATLPDQWRWRMQLHLRLNEPCALAGGGGPYRASVFQAVFHATGLADLARDEGFVRALADGTDPGRRRRPLSSAAALRSTDPTLARHTVQLRTGADIEHWVQEVILLHGREGDPSSPSFWLQKCE